MKKRPRRVRWPAEATPHVLAPLQRLSHAELMAARLRLLSTVHDITQGRQPGRGEWNEVTDFINIVDTLVMQRRIVLDPAIVAEAERAMRDSARRFKAGASLRLDGPGLEAVRAVMDVWLICLTEMTRAEVAKAEQDTHRRLLELIRTNTVTVVDMTGAPE